MCYSPWGCKKLDTALQLNNNNSIFSRFSHSVLSNSAIPWAVAHQASLSLTISRSLPKFIELVILSNHLILFHPLFLLSSVFHRIRVFSNEWALHIRWQKYWSLSFSICASTECSELISFRIDWFDFAGQGNLKSLLLYHNSKPSIL